MPKVNLNPGKKHYVAISEPLFNQLQDRAVKEMLYVTQYVNRELLRMLELEGNALQNSHASGQPTDLDDGEF